MTNQSLAAKRRQFESCLAIAAAIVASHNAEKPEGFEVFNAQTLVSDVIVPSVFLPYVVERTAELSEFFTSGIVDTDQTFAGLAAQGGQTVVMPFWQDLQGDDQVLSDTGPLTTKKIGASSDVAVINNRGDAWSTNDLAKYLSGADPMKEIGDLVAGYWARKSQKLLISQLKGIFLAASMAGNKTDIHATSGSVGEANTLTATSFINTKQLMGDAKEKLVAIAMHSQVEAYLEAQDLIDTIPGSEGDAQMIKMFRGLRVIVDDGMPVEVINSAPVYHTFLFGRGAFAMGVSSQDDPIEGGFGTWQLEFARVALAHQNVMINRRRFILHPRGVKWVGTFAGLSPTNAEFEDAAAWSRVYEAKNVRIVRLRHNVLF
jgi:hypothetical protein